MVWDAACFLKAINFFFMKYCLVVYKFVDATHRKRGYRGLVINCAIMKNQISHQCAQVLQSRYVSIVSSWVTTVTDTIELIFATSLQGFWSSCTNQFISISPQHTINIFGCWLM